VLRSSSVYRHAVVITPAARWALIARGTAFSNRFPVPGGSGLPHHCGRSATTSDFSRPEERSLAVTACRLAESPSDPSVSKAPTVGRRWLAPPVSLSTALRTRAAIPPYRVPSRGSASIGPQRLEARSTQTGSFSDDRDHRAIRLTRFHRGCASRMSSKRNTRDGFAL
jgi:hypothetical protein